MMDSTCNPLDELPAEAASCLPARCVNYQLLSLSQHGYDMSRVTYDETKNYLGKNSEHLAQYIRLISFKRGHHVYIKSVAQVMLATVHSGTFFLLVCRIKT
jgi:hypothetical protein